jgi:hypothetical protein
MVIVTPELSPRTWFRKGASMEKFSLTALVRQQLTIARQASSGRSAHTVYGVWVPETQPAAVTCR